MKWTMAKKKKQGDTLTYRVHYDVDARAEGVVLISVRRDDIKHKYNKPVESELRDYIEGEVENMAEGYQRITHENKSGSIATHIPEAGEITPDYEGNAEWTYYPDRTEIREIEDVTDEIGLHLKMDICSTTMSVFTPLPDGVIDEPFAVSLHPNGVKQVVAVITADPQDCGVHTQFKGKAMTHAEVRRYMTLIQQGMFTFADSSKLLKGSSQAREKLVTKLYNGIL